MGEWESGRESERVRGGGADRGSEVVVGSEVEAQPQHCFFARGRILAPVLVLPHLMR